MSDDKQRFDKGAEKMSEVYDGIVPPGDHGSDPFMDLMVSHIFGEVWTREALSVRDRRLFTMGIIAAMGEKDVFGIQCSAALSKGELTPEQLREMVIHSASYAGYPRVGGLRGAAEQAIAGHEKATK